MFPKLPVALIGITVSTLIGPAVMIAFLGGIESLLSAVVADRMTNTKHNSNRELIVTFLFTVFTNLTIAVKVMLQKTGVYDIIGADHFF